MDAALTQVGNCPACGNPIYAPEQPDFAGQPQIKRTCACVPLTTPFWPAVYPYGGSPVGPAHPPPYVAPLIPPPNICGAGGVAGSGGHQQAW